MISLANESPAYTKLGSTAIGLVIKANRFYSASISEKYSLYSESILGLICNSISSTFNSSPLIESAEKLLLSFGIYYLDDTFG